MSTTLRKKESVTRRWLQIDASKYTLGRLASIVATKLSGKHRTDFTPHVDMGDFVVVVNAPLVRFTGRKLEQKRYFHYSGYPGGMHSILLKDLLAKKPAMVIREAVRRMLPKNKLQPAQLRRLRILADDKHSFKIDDTIS